MTSEARTNPSSDGSSTRTNQGNPLRWLFDLFSSVRFGIVLLFLLFVYSGIGSAGLPLTYAIWEPGAWTAVRAWRGLEMTEYEWFNWWPFFVLVALTCLTLIVTTLRRIRFSVINLGVWMVHTGLITLAVGCVIYFATKIEGDVPIARTRIVIQPAGGPQASLRVMPGHQVEMTTSQGPWRFQIIDTDPNWELLSGDDKGQTAYAVKVMVESPSGMFIRQLLAGYPEFTEDMVQSNNPNQPWARAVKETGQYLVDDTLMMELAPDTQSRFWVMDSAALYFREVRATVDGSYVPLTLWVERPIEGLPRYNEYIELATDAWLPTGDDAVKTGPLVLPVPAASPDDPLGDEPLYVTAYLPYAGMESRDTPGGDHHNPVVNLTLDTTEGRQVAHRMFALDKNPTSPDPSLMRFVWIDHEDEIESMAEARGPRLRIGVPSEDLLIEEDIAGFTELDPNAPWIPVEGTDYAWRVQRIDNDIQIRGRSLNMARVEMRNGNQTWLRWVFDTPSLNGDFPLDGPIDAHLAQDRQLDESITTTYLPAIRPLAPVTLVAGPEEDRLRLVSTLMPGGPEISELTVNTPHSLGPDVTMNITSYDAKMGVEIRPRVVARRARQPRAGGQLSMVKIRLPDAKRQAWLTYHHYPFEHEQDVLRRFSYQPSVMTMPDGRLIEVMYSRQSAPLPSEVSLEGFDVRSHVGGFTGEVSSVLNWISNVRFEDDGGEVLAPVSVNDPKQREGYWYFQAQWDPPEQATASSSGTNGLNYTILGVGNRNGVWTMLAGSVLSVIGMIYAFYVKPMIRRRRAMDVYKGLQETTA
ncbi:MAG: hypothetical protein VX527_04405 [Planctomycetota bacterium]|nr:hypothetical protein [Planctomycetota bacterium]